MTVNTFLRMARRFGRAQDGNVAMLWGLMGAVLVALVGLTVDFTRAQSVRAQMQNAADGAVLVAERASARSLAQRTAAARAYFDSTLGEQPVDGTVTFAVTQLPDGGHRVTANAVFDNGLSLVARLFGAAENWNVAVTSEAMAQASPPIEVALVLDNTGSMSNDMQALRDAATDLVNSLYALDGDTVSVAVVPFVAQVNIGTSGSGQMSWMDVNAQNPLHAEFLEDRYIVRRSSSGTSNCTTLPTVVSASPYRLTWVRSGSYCYGFTPDQINNFTLYDQISNVDWGGCVEARPEPYDISDAAPSAANPSTLFVPYFWHDDGDDVSGPNNNYISDGTLPSGTLQANARTFSVFKYDGRSATVSTAPPNATGPNMGCPTPITPLTTNSATVVSAIAALRHWNGGGTNQIEGLAWGWRVLSPTAPFTQGSNYGDSRKVIVLMTDGQNTNLNSNNPAMTSHYSAYNFRNLWASLVFGQSVAGATHGLLPAAYRRSISGSSSSFVSYINTRELQLCTAIKNAGIEIYTVVFREPDAATRQMLRDCATDADHAFTADTQAELQQVFHAIGSGIGELRLTR